MDSAVKTKVQHTPGPWKIGGDDGSIWVEPPIATENVICDLVKRHADSPTDEDEANARLIAAAPEMYEALKRLAKWYEGNTAANAQSFGESYYSTYLAHGSNFLTKRLRDEAEAAIAKAEGRQ